MNSTQRHKALSHCCLMQNLLSTCAQLALACQALCISNLNRHNKPNQTSCLAEGCNLLQVHPLHNTAYQPLSKSALAPPALLSSISAGAQQESTPPIGGMLTSTCQTSVGDYMASEPPSPSGHGPLPLAVAETPILLTTGTFHFTILLLDVEKTKGPY